MRLRELYKSLKENGIDDNSIYLHGLYGSSNDDEKLSLTVKRGKYSMIWEVYYKERGEKHSIREFQTEKAACEYYSKKMKENEMFGTR